MACFALAALIIGLRETLGSRANLTENSQMGATVPSLLGLVHPYRAWELISEPTRHVLICQMVRIEFSWIARVLIVLGENER